MTERVAREGAEAVRQVLEQRAALLARPVLAETRTDTVETLVMALGSEHYGVPVAAVHEIVPLTDLAPVPGVPPIWRGVVNIRGTLYPILALRRHLGLPAEVREEDAPESVVLVSAGPLTVGLAVDGVPEIHQLAATAVQPALGTAGRGGDWVRGTTEDLITIVDVEALLADPALVVREELQ